MDGMLEIVQTALTYSNLVVQLIGAQSAQLAAKLELHEEAGTSSRPQVQFEIKDLATAPDCTLSKPHYLFFFRRGTPLFLKHRVVFTPDGPDRPRLRDLTNTVDLMRPDDAIEKTRHLLRNLGFDEDRLNRDFDFEAREGGLSDNSDRPIPSSSMAESHSGSRFSYPTNLLAGGRV